MLKRESVLKNKAIQFHNGIEFQELSHVPKVNLRGEFDDKDFITNAEKILNTLLPTEPNISNVSDKAKVIWLSPNEWLVEIKNAKNFKEILSKLESTFNSQNTAVTDLTENRTILKVSGHNLYTLLSKFMVIDLDTVLQKETSVAQTLFIKVPVLLVRNHNEREKPSIDIHTNRSHARYIYNILVDGSRNLDF